MQSTDLGAAEVLGGGIAGGGARGGCCQQKEGSLTSLLFNSLLINPVRQGVRMNNVTVCCTLTAIITVWRLLQLST